MKTLRICAALIALACSAVSAHAATRVYELGGLGCPFLNPAASVALQLRARGAIVQTDCFYDAGSFEADALAHRSDRIVVIGHSMGAKTGTVMADDLARRGMSVKMIALDALFTGAAAHRAPTVHFWQGGYQMHGAHNVHVASAYGHVGFPNDPNVQARVIAAAGFGRVPRLRKPITRHHRKAG
jgi:pimeloyl-ACP methyl ester carboxylesterase